MLGDSWTAGPSLPVAVEVMVVLAGWGGEEKPQPHRLVVWLRPRLRTSSGRELPGYAVSECQEGI